MKKVLGILVYVCMCAGLHAQEVEDPDRPGCFTTYHVNGHVLEDGCYDQEHRKTGSWRTYTDKGTPTTITNYKNGLLDGLMITFTEHGEIESEANYMDGMLQVASLWLYFYILHWCHFWSGRL